jgi:hypothetical protein
MESKMFRLMASLLGSGCLLLAESVPPIACNLKSLTSEQRKQLGEIGEHVISAMTTSRELNDGYSFRTAKCTIEGAQALYEVTMQEAGVSKLVSVKFKPPAERMHTNEGLRDLREPEPQAAMA